jgi:hypothetical protein
MATTPPAPATFYDHFAANMEAMGLSAPRGLFETSTKATATISAIAGAMKHYGPRVTVREILLTIPAFASAPAVAELALLAGGVFAAFYVGACIGSFAVATGKTLALVDLTTVANQLRLSGPWLMPALTHTAAQRPLRGR